MPPLRAEECGHCAKPLTDDSPTLGYCGEGCRIAYSQSQAFPIPTASAIRIQPTRESEPTAEPSWLVAWSEWERKKAAAVIEARRVPATPYVPGSASKKVAEGMADAEPIHPLTPAPGDVANGQRAQDDRIQQATAIQGEAA